MKVFIKGKEFKKWNEEFRAYSKQQALTVATHYINLGYDVKIERS